MQKMIKKNDVDQALSQLLQAGSRPLWPNEEAFLLLLKTSLVSGDDFPFIINTIIVTIYVMYFFSNLQTSQLNLHVFQEILAATCFSKEWRWLIAQ